MTKCKQFVLKCENLQKVGAFKPRGAFNKVLQLESNIKTVCTHSSGNHAQALAYAAKKLGL
jgi:threonine dehydratase